MQTSDLIVAVFVPSFVEDLSLGIANPFIPLFAINTLKLNTTQVGLLVSAQGLGLVLSTVAAGKFTEAYGDIPTMKISCVIGVCSGLIAAGSNSFWLLLLACMLYGLRRALWNISRQEFLAQHSDPQFRGQAMSLVGGTNRTGNLLGPLAGGVIASNFPTQYVFLCQSLAALISLVLIIYFERTRADLLGKTARDVELRKRDGDMEMTDGVMEFEKTMWEMLKDNYSVFSRVAVMCAILMLLRTARKFLLPLLGTSFELTPFEVGAVVSGSFLVDVLGFPLAGKLSDECGRKFSAGPAIVIMSIGFLVLPAATNFSGLLLVGGVLGFGNSLSAGLVYTFGVDIAPQVQRAQFLGLFNLAFNLGTFGAPLLAGWLIDEFSVFVSCMAMVVFGIAGLWWVLFLIEEPNPKHMSAVERMSLFKDMIGKCLSCT